MTSYSQYQLPTLWKEAQNGQYAHVYEHIIARHIINTMRAHGYLLVADFDIWANVYGARVYVETRIQSKNALRVFKKSLDSLPELTPEIIHHAIAECSIEYMRPLIHLEVTTLIEALSTLHAQPWHPLASLFISTATSDTSVNTAFDVDGLHFGYARPKTFHEIAVEYEVPENVYFELQELKALSALIIQAIALNQNALLAETLSFYDTGDEWAKGIKTIAYRSYLRLHGDNLIAETSLNKLIQDNIDHLKDLNFAKNLAAAIQRNYSNEASHYFTLHALNNITEGVVIGYAGWRQVATPENINAILDALVVTTIIHQK